MNLICLKCNTKCILDNSSKNFICQNTVCQNKYIKKK